MPRVREFSNGLNDAGADPGPPRYTGRFIELRLHEDSEKLSIKFARPYLGLDNAESPFGGHRWFIGAVACDQGVVDVTDRHDACLRRYEFPSDLVGISGPVQSFMMFVSNFGNLLKPLAPGNHFQNVVRLVHVTFDLDTLSFRERALRDAELPALVFGKRRQNLTGVEGNL